jgi:hypothetical protein
MCKVDFEGVIAVAIPAGGSNSALVTAPGMPRWMATLSGVARLHVARKSSTDHTCQREAYLDQCGLGAVLHPLPTVSDERQGLQ